MIEPLDLSDDEVAARVIEIQRAAYATEAELIGFDGIPPLHESVDDIRRADLKWLGCWEDGRLVGIMAWSVMDGTTDIDRLAVHPDHFRRGHGRALVSSVVDGTVTVSTGTANHPALRLYESLGFNRIAEGQVAPGVTVTELMRASAG